MENLRATQIEAKIMNETDGLSADSGLSAFQQKVLVLPADTPAEALLGTQGSVVIDGVEWARPSISTHDGKDRYAIGGERELCKCGGFINKPAEVRISTTCSVCDTPDPSGIMAFRPDIANRYEGSICNVGMKGYCVTLNDLQNIRASRLKGVAGDWEKTASGLGLKKVRFSGKTGAIRVRFVDSSKTYFPTPLSAGFCLAVIDGTTSVGILPIHPARVEEIEALGVEVVGNIYGLLNAVGKRRITMGGKEKSRPSSGPQNGGVA